MTKEKIYELLKQLARSQGCRGRMLAEWNEYGMTEDALTELENMNFQNGLDLILFLEGN